MAARFVAAPAPELTVLPHDFVGVWEGHVHRCVRCPLPRRNRVHDPDAARQARARDYSRFDAARLGERDPDD